MIIETVVNEFFGILLDTALIVVGVFVIYKMWTWLKLPTWRK